MEKPVVIYAFRSPGSGAVYIGKHECDPEGWPRRGTGRLPDGYAGGGVVVARFHARHGDRVEWRILAVVSLAEWSRAERRAIHLTRLLLGKRCVNIRDGGDGWTREEARRLFVSDPVQLARLRRQAPIAARASARACRDNPEWARRLSVAMTGRKLTPETCAKLSAVKRGVPKSDEHKAKIGAGSRAAWRCPEKAGRMLEGVRAAAQRPERNAKVSASLKARAKTPEGQAHLARAVALNSTPEAIAKRQRTRRVNDGWRRLAEKHPEWWVI